MLTVLLLAQGLWRDLRFRSVRRAAVPLGVPFLVRVGDSHGQLRDLQARAVIDAS
jgi:hypothetical protein